jgi:hypothetical protein
MKKLKDLQSALEQGIENETAAVQGMTGADEPMWLADKSLRGPAGRYVYGLHLGAAQREALPAPVTLAPDRDGQVAAELARRAEARTPYLAPERDDVRITRIATSEPRQTDDVAEHLARTGLAARPDLVHGVYRVPDHIDGGTLKGAIGSGRLVEWEIVHGEADDLPPAPAPTAAWFDAGDTWVARRIGSPMVHDEDLALAYLAGAGVGPEQTLGVSRFLDIHHEPTSDEETSYTASYVTGMHVWHPADLGGAAAAELRAHRPLPVEPSADVQVVVLNWAGVRQAVAPVSGEPPLAPSPFPYLPSTPQELLLAYLDVVGVRAGDSFAAAVTEDAPKDLNSVTHKGGVTLRTNRGAPQPCVDGVLRPRLSGGARIVLVYRDRPEYVEGRARFAAYEAEVLRSQLEKGAERRPLEYTDATDRLPGGLRGLAKATVAVGMLFNAESSTVFEKLPPFRYCWPPT